MAYLQINIIETGSNGNCFLFNQKLMIDVGVPFSHLAKVDISKLEYILLTHKHGDHFKESTIRAIHIKNPKIIFVVAPFLFKKLVDMGMPLSNITVVVENEVSILGEFIISPVKLFHDVHNIGYRIMYKKHKHIHITDTNTVEHIRAYRYDTATIEANHCPVEAQKIIDNSSKFSHLVKALKYHLSVNKMVDFCNKNEIKAVYPIHIGGSTKTEVMKYIKENIKSEVR